MTNTGRTTGLIITGVIALVVGVGIGVAGFAVATGDDPESPTDSTTSTGKAEYSMSSVNHACDLIDPTMLARWSYTPKGPPVHRETRPTSLSCDVAYAPPPVDPIEYHVADLRLEARFTDGAAEPAYDRWKRRDTAPTGSDREANGEVTGIGAQGYWHLDTGVSLMPELSYILAVRDGNVSVRVKISIRRTDIEPPVSREEIDSVARSEVELALNGLEKK